MQIIKGREIFGRTILIIPETDIITNDHQFKGQRFSMVFIHKDHPEIDKLRTMLYHCLQLNNSVVGNIFLYE